MACQYVFELATAYFLPDWPNVPIKIIGATYVDQQTGSGTYFDLSTLPECFDDSCVETVMETAFPAQLGTSWVSNVSGGSIGGAYVSEKLVSIDVSSGSGQFSSLAVTGACTQELQSSVSVNSSNAIFSWDELQEQAYLESIIAFFLVLTSFFIGLYRKI